VKVARNYADWLEAFVDYASVGEAPLHILYWVGVSTIAGALRRRVWVEQEFFQWVPNFYIVVVAPPAVVSKSTTANIGFNLLGKVEGIHFGPDITSWQALIAEMDGIGEEYEYEGGHFKMHAITCAIDEFGTFLDPTDREQVDSLVRLWDGKLSDRAFRKVTKTQGSDTLNNPWINIYACTQPAWLNTNFPESFLGGGFISRIIFLHADAKRQRVPLLSKAIKARIAREPKYALMPAKLTADLAQMAALHGPFELTSAAEVYAEENYNAQWDKIEGKVEATGFAGRKQTHLFKLAMVISVSRGDFPKLDVEHLKEAERQLALIEPGITRVLQVVGSKGITKASQEILDAVRGEGGKAFRRDIFGKHFFRRLSNKDFEEAVKGAQAAGKLREDKTPAGVVLTIVGAA
jgi:hypothetical protein